MYIYIYYFTVYFLHQQVSYMYTLDKITPSCPITLEFLVLVHFKYISSEFQVFCTSDHDQQVKFYCIFELVINIYYDEASCYSSCIVV